MVYHGSGPARGSRCGDGWNWVWLLASYPSWSLEFPRELKAFHLGDPQPLRVYLGVALDANFGSFHGESAVPLPSLGDSGTELRG